MLPRPQPAESFENLKGRIDRFFAQSEPVRRARNQYGLLFDAARPGLTRYPRNSIAELLDFVSDAVPDGEVYLFGGLVRDLALYGRRGFKSDVDVVVEGNWAHCISYLESLGARRNRFGGFRLHVGDFPVDIWNAQDTWAIREGLVVYRNIASLTETTILNWDAILMNWRTGTFVCRADYLQQLRERILDIVLTRNPNPLGMVVRVFRHLCSKDARKVTASTAEFLARSTAEYGYDAIRSEEIRSYGDNLIEPAIYRLFEHTYRQSGSDISQKFRGASATLKRELGLV